MILIFTGIIFTFVQLTFDTSNLVKVIESSAFQLDKGVVSLIIYILVLCAAVIFAILYLREKKLGKASGPALLVNDIAQAVFFIFELIFCIVYGKCNTAIVLSFIANATAITLLTIGYVRYRKGNLAAFSETK